VIHLAFPTHSLQQVIEYVPWEPGSKEILHDGLGVFGLDGDDEHESPGSLLQIELALDDPFFQTGEEPDNFGAPVVLVYSRLPLEDDIAEGGVQVPLDLCEVRRLGLLG
jgi:hypothetical protein